MDRIGLFGGTFDPYTVAHQAIVEKILELNLVDLVVLLPTIVDYHRHGKTKWLNDTEKFKVMYEFIVRSKFQDRIMMDFREVRMKNANTLSDEEISKWRFINTLERCMKLYEGSELYTIIGTDSLRNFKSWSRWQDILENSKLITVVGRNGESVDTDIPFIPVEIDDRFSAVSSSDIRSKFGNIKDYINHTFNGEK